MSCVIDHVGLLRANPQTLRCPDCHVPLKGPTVIDLTTTSPVRLAPTPGMPITPAAIPALLTPKVSVKQESIERYSDAHALASTKLEESVASTSRPTKDIINSVGINIYVAEEYTDTIGTLEIVRFEKLRRCRVVSARTVSLTMVFEDHGSLISYLKAQWNIPAPFFQEANCRIVGSVTTGNGATVADLPLNPQHPVSLLDLKPMMVDSTKDKFSINLYFPQSVDVRSDDDTVRRPRKRKSAAAPTGSLFESDRSIKNPRLHSFPGAVRPSSSVKSEALDVSHTSARLVKSESEGDVKEEHKPGRGNRFENLGPPLLTRAASRSAVHNTSPDVLSHTTRLRRTSVSHGTGAGEEASTP